MNRKQIDEMPELMTPAQAMRLLQCGRKALRKLRQARPDVAHKPPGFEHWRYRKIALLSAAGLSPTD